MKLRILTLALAIALLGAGVGMSSASTAGDDSRGDRSRQASAQSSDSRIRSETVRRNCEAPRCDYFRAWVHRNGQRYEEICFLWAKRPRDDNKGHVFGSINLKCPKRTGTILLSGKLVRYGGSGEDETFAFETKKDLW